MPGPNPGWGMRITKRGLDELRRSPPAARTAYWDDALKGFGVRVSPDGGIAFVLKYRLRGDPRQRFVTLGDYPALQPDRAREEAARIKAAARLGEDLVAARQAERAAAEAAAAEARRRAIPLAELLDGWRAATEAAAAQKAAQGRSASYERELLRYEASVLRPAIGGDTVGQFDPAKLQALLFRQPSVYVARNLRNLIASFVRHANAELALRGLAVRWPTRFEVAGRITPRSDRYTLEEAARIWIGAGRLGRRGAMLRFMLLTGCRLIEARTAEWGHLRLDDPVLGPYWEQPAHLTKNGKPHRVPLASPLVALLRWLPPRRTKAGTSPLIFAGRGGKPVSGITDVRAAMREAAGLPRGTLHDMRRTIVSVLGDHGFDPQVADALLNHVAASSMPGVMGIYQRSEFWLKKREAIATFTELLMAEVGRIQGQPVDPVTWGFDTPFEEVRLVRPRAAAAGEGTGRPPRRAAGRPRAAPPARS